MVETWVRIYHLKNGQKVVAGAYYPSEELAIKDLHIYNPVKDGEGYRPDLSDVSYATVERRFSPLPAVDMGWPVGIAI